MACRVQFFHERVEEGPVLWSGSWREREKQLEFFTQLIVAFGVPSLTFSLKLEFSTLQKQLGAMQPGAKHDFSVPRFPTCKWEL